MKIYLVIQNHHKLMEVIVSAHTNEEKAKEVLGVINAQQGCVGKLEIIYTKAVCTRLYYVQIGSKPCLNTVSDDRRNVKSSTIWNEALNDAKRNYNVKAKDSGVYMKLDDGKEVLVATINSVEVDTQPSYLFNDNIPKLEHVNSVYAVLDKEGKLLDIFEDVLVAISYGKSLKIKTQQKTIAKPENFTGTMYYIEILGKPFLMSSVVKSSAQELVETDYYKQANENRYSPPVIKSIVVNNKYSYELYQEYTELTNKHKLYILMKSDQSEIYGVYSDYKEATEKFGLLRINQHDSSEYSKYAVLKDVDVYCDEVPESVFIPTVTTTFNKTIRIVEKLANVSYKNLIDSRAYISLIFKLESGNELRVDSFKVNEDLWNYNSEYKEVYLLVDYSTNRIYGVFEEKNVAEEICKDFNFFNDAKIDLEPLTVPLSIKDALVYTYRLLDNGKIKPYLKVNKIFNSKEDYNDSSLNKFLSESEKTESVLLDVIPINDTSLLDSLEGVQ